MRKWARRRKRDRRSERGCRPETPFCSLRWPSEYRGRYFFADFKHGWIKTLDPAKPATARPFATSVRRPVDLRFTADGSLLVLLRDAWVIDKLFKGGTGVLLRIRYTGG